MWWMWLAVQTASKGAAQHQRPQTTLNRPPPPHAIIAPTRYLLRITVTGKGMVADTKKDYPFWVRNYDVAAEEAPPIKVRFGWLLLSYM